MKRLFKILVLFILLIGSVRTLNSVWRWECNKGFCQKTAITPETEIIAQSLQECRLFCSSSAALWPLPTGNIHIGRNLTTLNLKSINIFGVDFEKPNANLISAAFKRFKEQIFYLKPPKRKVVDGGQSLTISYVITNPDINKLTLDTDESYSLKVSVRSAGDLEAIITADNYFGVRHGLETLNQLIIYDSLRDEIKIPSDVEISDKPAYPYRGILLDTARNYATVDVIKRTIDGMATSKLNTFHWHLTDSQSFPYVSESLPDLSKYGAYSISKVYTPEDIDDIVQYGMERGVRIVPEFDAPAHVGEGWQNTDFLTCFNAKPWMHYCFQPPCGQFDPTKEKLYDALEALYGDMLKHFQPEIFHMGGDEVHFGCWDGTNNIVQWMQNQGWGRSENDFIKLWAHFQNESLTRLHKQAGKDIPVVLWTSKLTNRENLKFIPKEKYIIQIWAFRHDPHISDILNNGYKVILSNHDALYMDCGFASWVSYGSNSCSPYKGWQKVYGNTPEKIVGNKTKQVLGGEVALWSEQTDSATIDTRLWPRASAMAEVFWSEPTGTWRDAEHRILVQRERLVEKGINADALEPEWCLQNEENCPVKSKLN